MSDRPAPGLRGVCRFLGTFATRAAHFFTAHPEECESLKRSSEWTFEGEPFYVHPTRDDGSCPVGTGPVYRLYNGGREGVPNHRFTPVRSERSRLIALGWLPEGAGPDGVAFCVPISPGVAFARLQAFVADDWYFTWQREAAAFVARLSFDAVTASGEDEFPFQAASVDGDVARWDPFLNRMVVFLTGFGTVERFVFPYNGDDHGEGCRYSWQLDGVYFGPLPPFDQLRFGPCQPVDIARLPAA